MKIIKTIMVCFILLGIMTYLLHDYIIIYKFIKRYDKYDFSLFEGYYVWYRGGVRVSKDSTTLVVELDFKTDEIVSTKKHLLKTDSINLNEINKRANIAIQFAKMKCNQIKVEDKNVYISLFKENAYDIVKMNNPSKYNVKSGKKGKHIYSNWYFIQG